MPFISMESDAAMTAVALCVLSAGSMVMLIGGAAYDARHTVAAVALAVLASGWALLIGTGDALRAGIVLSDQGISLTLAGFGALLCVMPVADRSRAAGLALFALMVNAAALHYIYPLLEDTLPLQSLAASLYNVLILSAAAGFVLLCKTPRSDARFSSRGEYRVTLSSVLTKEAWAGGLLALGMTMLILRMRGSEGVDVESLLYTCLTGALVAAFSALMIAVTRRMPFAVSHAFLTLPAGVLAVGLVDELNTGALCALAVFAGMLSSLCRELLVRMRFDEPSQSIACLCVPAIVGLMAPGMQDKAALPSQAAWVAALAISGLALGYAARLFAQATLGLAPSRRAREEGLDKRYAL